MSVCEEWIDEELGMPQYTCASEVVIARNDIPSEEHDVKMDVIFSENYLTFCK